MTIDFVAAVAADFVAAVAASRRFRQVVGDGGDRVAAQKGDDGFRAAERADRVAGAAAEWCVMAGGLILGLLALINGWLLWLRCRRPLAVPR
jgi:uncharacterized membrane protein